MENRNHGNYTTPSMEMSAVVCVACSRKRPPTNTNALGKNVQKIGSSMGNKS